MTKKRVTCSKYWYHFLLAFVFHWQGILTFLRLFRIHRWAETKYVSFLQPRIPLTTTLDHSTWAWIQFLSERCNFFYLLFPPSLSIGISDYLPSIFMRSRVCFAYVSPKHVSYLNWDMLVIFSSILLQIFCMLHILINRH